MGTERRCTQRKTPRQLSYVQLDQNGGGIVLNASENGLAFQVVAAVRSQRAIHVCISQNPSARIELNGEIAWLDNTKMRGGVKFEDVSDSLRDRIRSWLAAESDSHDLHPLVATLPGASHVEIAAATEPRIENPALAKHLEAEGVSERDRASGVASQVVPFDGPLLRGSLSVPIPKPADGFFAFATRFLLHITAAILLSVLVLTPIMFSRNLRSRFADSLIRLGARLKYDEQADVPALQSTPAQSSAPNSANTSAIPNADLEVRAGETRSGPNPLPSRIVRRKTQESTARGLDDRSHAAGNLRDRHPPERGSVAHQLWSAVESGDTSAEVSLAQLYIAGDGVPKNCAQARILLKAASKRGNQEALQQLNKLNKNGCR